ncbi:hypothetical protein C8E03_108170 [Lachnotalea glycerini]|uniref:Uncharacterized protein n=1 Tax=Lachnotalea glycerini TaxID=1763509 RepID=A0A318EPY8_9FIRM|nr:hypothetical protein [Lachnotalea glycerini]PXV88443.1 hypothetical protein C8E03_108170 [Lachnotalea glycerini]
MNKIEQLKPLTIGILGYNTDLSFRGLHDLACDNEEQVEQHKKEFLKLADETKIIPITNTNLLSSRRAVRIDQLILFDDDRWLIESNKAENILKIKRFLLCHSCVPEEYQILKYEDVF